MNSKIVTRSAFLAFSLLFASNAIAEKGSVQVPDNVKVNGKSIRAGNYRLKWSGAGNVNLAFLLDGKLIATVPAHTISLEKADSYNSASFTKNDDGSESLVEIHFGNKKYGLSLRNASAPSQAGNGANE